MRTSEDAARDTALQTFGLHLKRLRLAADLTQEEMAERAGVSARLISDLERGTIHRPRRDTIQLLADGLRLRGSDRDTFVALARGQSVAPVRDADPSRPRLSMPRPPTPIVGRRQELAQAVALLLDPDIHMLTLTGPGGVGKTRLAVEIASIAAETTSDEAVFVDLAPVGDPELVLTAIAQALEVQANPEQPLWQTVVGFLRDKRILIVLDNFEQVADAASMIAELLAACAQLTILATSRKPLHIRAEHQFPVGPLALPDVARLPGVAELSTVAAVELFLRRAQAASRQFALTSENARAVAAITIRLDGLPLAIELAATRANVLSPATLLDHLERRLPLLTRGFKDLPERQQALRATLDWSHDLLSTAEQVLFRRLSVFAGSCSLDGAEAVSGVATWIDLPEPACTAGGRMLLPNLLAALVDTSLLRALPTDTGELRFGMLETVREYGQELLAAANEDISARNSHLAWCLDLARRAEPELTGAAQQQWYSRLQSEHDNIRAALAWAISQQDTESALGLGGAMYRFWAVQGHYEEGRRWLETALAMPAKRCSSLQGHAHLGVGVMAFFQGEYDYAETHWGEALSIFSDMADSTGVAYSHGNLGLVADAQGDYERANASYKAALALFRELDDSTYIAYMLHNLGLIAYFQGDYARATELYEESLTLVRALGDQNSIAMTLGNLGQVAFVQGEFEQARTLQLEALTLGRRLSNRPWLARGVVNFALIAAATNAPERAAKLFGAAEAMREQFNQQLPPNDRDFNARYIADVTASLGSERFSAAWAVGRAMSLDEAIDFALAPYCHESVP